MLHFAYGSNMGRALMRVRCRDAEALGVAFLKDFRFIITRDGYASILATPGEVVRGVLWNVGPRDVAALNLYESVASGLYRPHLLSVQLQGRRKPALTYIGRATAAGRPRPGYLELVINAAREWELPARYLHMLESSASSRWRGARPAEAGEIACPVSAT